MYSAWQKTGPPRPQSFSLPHLPRTIPVSSFPSAVPSFKLRSSRPGNAGVVLSGWTCSIDLRLAKLGTADCAYRGIAKTSRHKRPRPEYRPETARGASRPCHLARSHLEIFLLLFGLIAFPTNSQKSPVYSSIPSSEERRQTLTTAALRRRDAAETRKTLLVWSGASTTTWLTHPIRSARQEIGIHRQYRALFGRQRSDHGCQQNRRFSTLPRVLARAYRPSAALGLPAAQRLAIAVPLKSALQRLM
ncbi:uncharacterized protein B0T15DRAFT_41042 [Chaetomium strumarium]|uniref:Uncharacterized protein n=1 Tax=Chaetomium strumarium TaxID=1170767 RepID=A0AAJ0H2A4_9PEZI|nr:hypothetical protein B0T15DRAFT_41042 [Chaetomium strumarium]